ncbi:hypothetical protein MTY_1740 [Moorella thermoacetica Y72]|uniref:Uncharacterized protein n=1 Tax=Moorella thermoacetica Y72 TaxID=1325331 RepID=A0A0S6UG82_NEOTH|nr:hypothetical protein MTY_1740 [Moorella thermoacetica Y72]
MNKKFQSDHIKFIMIKQDGFGNGQAPATPFLPPGQQQS